MGVMSFKVVDATTAATATTVNILLVYISRGEKTSALLKLHVSSVLCLWMASAF